MRVGILQSNYVPWRGYFDLMDDCDIFIIYDEVQYTKSDWRNRNKLKAASGATWMTVPVRREGLGIRIDQAHIDWTRDWPKKHKQLLLENYRDAPCRDAIASDFFAEIDQRYERLSALNVALLKRLAAHLYIETDIVLSTGLGSAGGRPSAWCHSSRLLVGQLTCLARQRRPTSIQLSSRTKVLHWSIKATITSRILSFGGRSMAT